MDDPQFYTTRDGRELSTTDAALLAQIDAKADELRALLETVAAWHPSSWHELHSARINFRQGLMWLRSVASRSKAF